MLETEFHKPVMNLSSKDIVNNIKSWNQEMGPGYVVQGTKGICLHPCV